MGNKTSKATLNGSSIERTFKVHFQNSFEEMERNKKKEFVSSSPGFHSKESFEISSKNSTEDIDVANELNAVSADQESITPIDKQAEVLNFINNSLEAKLLLNLIPDGTTPTEELVSNETVDRENSFLENSIETAVEVFPEELSNVFENVQIDVRPRNDSDSFEHINEDYPFLNNSTIDNNNFISNDKTDVESNDKLTPVESNGKLTLVESNDKLTDDESNANSGEERLTSDETEPFSETEDCENNYSESETSSKGNDKKNYRKKSEKRTENSMVLKGDRFGQALLGNVVNVYQDCTIEANSKKGKSKKNESNSDENTNNDSMNSDSSSDDDQINANMQLRANRVDQSAMVGNVVNYCRGVKLQENFDPGSFQPSSFAPSYNSGDFNCDPALSRTPNTSSSSSIHVGDINGIPGGGHSNSNVVSSQRDGGGGGPLAGILIGDVNFGNSSYSQTPTPVLQEKQMGEEMPSPVVEENESSIPDHFPNLDDLKANEKNEIKTRLINENIKDNNSETILKDGSEIFKEVEQSFDETDQRKRIDDNFLKTTIMPDNCEIYKDHSKDNDVSLDSLSSNENFEIGKVFDNIKELEIVAGKIDEEFNDKDDSFRGNNQTELKHTQYRIIENSNLPENESESTDKRFNEIETINVNVACDSELTPVKNVDNFNLKNEEKSTEDDRSNTEEDKLIEAGQSDFPNELDEKLINKQYSIKEVKFIIQNFSGSDSINDNETTPSNTDFENDHCEREHLPNKLIPDKIENPQKSNDDFGDQNKLISRLDSKQTQENKNDDNGNPKSKIKKRNLSAPLFVKGKEEDFNDILFLAEIIVDVVFVVFIFCLLAFCAYKII